MIPTDRGVYPEWREPLFCSWMTRVYLPVGTPGLAHGLKWLQTRGSKKL